MIVTPFDHGLNIAPEDTKRSKGVHMSSLYGDLYSDLEPDRFVRGTKPAPALLAVGLALEQYTERLLLAADIDAHRPPEFRTPDEYGIAFSPDLLISNGILKGGEIKATFMSARDWPTEVSRYLPEKADRYVTQCKSYGHNLEIPDWVLYVWFLKGKWEKKLPNGEDSPLSDFRAYHLTFTAKEMRDEYSMLIRHGKRKGLL